MLTGTLLTSGIVVLECNRYEVNNVEYITKAIEFACLCPDGVEEIEIAPD